MSEGGKNRLTVLLPEDLIEKTRDVCFWTPGLTLSDLAETALKAEIRKRETRRGEPFPSRTGRIKTGRPLAK